MSLLDKLKKFEAQAETKQEPKILFTSAIISEDKININKELEKLAKSSEFKRLIYKTLFGIVHRGNSEDLGLKLSKAIERFRNVNKNEIIIYPKFP